jgi:ATP-dependent Clp protease ATP-binding subunit ClpA
VFEKYTEKARRTIFFARYEASQSGSPWIETEHLLLGVLREDKALARRFLRSDSTVDSIRRQIESHTTIREKVSTSVDLPLSHESKRVLAYGAEEAEGLSYDQIGPEHLLLGLLREEKCYAAEILRGWGLTVDLLRRELSRSVEDWSQQYFRDLLLSARNGDFRYALGRTAEYQRLKEILASRQRRNCIVVADGGVGKTAFLEGFAQYLTDMGTSFLPSVKKLLAVDIPAIVAWDHDLPKRFKAALNFALNDGGTIVIIDGLDSFVRVGEGSHQPLAMDILKATILQGGLQFIGTATDGEYSKCLEVAPWLPTYSQTITLPPLDEDTLIKILCARKIQLEQFHAVVYADDAIEGAARQSIERFANVRLTDKAVELLDLAGARTKVRVIGKNDEPPVVKGWDIAGIANEVEAETVMSAKSRDKTTGIKIFISHSSKDESLAEAITDLLLRALECGTDDIRCTSVPGFRLTAGAHTSVQLRRELDNCEVIIGILTKSSLSSQYVMFELGAGWVLKKHIVPVLGPEIDFSELPGPLSEVHGISFSVRSNWEQLIDDLSKILGVSKRQTSSYSRTIDRLTAWEPSPRSTGRTS